MAARTLGLPPWRRQPPGLASKTGEPTAPLLPVIPTAAARQPLDSSFSSQFRGSDGFGGGSGHWSSGITEKKESLRRRPCSGPMPPMPRWLRNKLAQMEMMSSQGAVNGGSSDAGGLQVVAPEEATAAKDDTQSGFGQSPAANIPSMETPLVPLQIPAHIAEQVGQRHMLFLQSQFGLNKDKNSRKANTFAERMLREETLKHAEERGLSVGKRIASRMHEKMIDEADERKNFRHRKSAAKQSTGKSDDDEQITKPRTKIVSLATISDVKASSSGQKGPKEKARSPRGKSVIFNVDDDSDDESFDERVKQRMMTKKQRLKRMCTQAKMKRSAAKQRGDGRATMSNQETAHLFSVFARYDVDKSDSLQMNELRAALNDIGIRPTIAEEKRTMVRILQEALGAEEGSEGDAGLDFETFAEVVPRLREALPEVRRTELEEKFNRSLLENGLYDLSHLRPTMESSGNTGPLSDVEFREVLIIFEGYETAAAQLKTTKPIGSVREVVTSLTDRTSDVGSDVPQFELFETLFHQASQRVVSLRRDNERHIAEEFKLSPEFFTEVRQDLALFLQMFHRFDEDHSGRLEENEIFELLSSFGMQVKGSRAETMLTNLIYKAKRTVANWNAVKNRRSKGLIEESEEDEGPDGNRQLVCSFVECLVLVQTIRNLEKEARQEQLQTIFLHYDTDRSGDVSIKEVSRLLRDLRCMPRTRQEQQEIRHILDEVDDDGNGTLSFSEFEFLVQRINEHMERAARIEEEKFASSIGMALVRCRELRGIFQEYVQKSGGKVLRVPDLRNILEKHMNKRYTSEALLDLFEAYSAESAGGVDAKGFLRLIYDLEGQLKKSAVPHH